MIILFMILGALLIWGLFIFFSQYRIDQLKLLSVACVLYSDEKQSVVKIFEESGLSRPCRFAFIDEQLTYLRDEAVVDPDKLEKATWHNLYVLLHWNKLMKLKSKSRKLPEYVESSRSDAKTAVLYLCINNNLWMAKIADEVCLVNVKFNYAYAGLEVKVDELAMVDPLPVTIAVKV